MVKLRCHNKKCNNEWDYKGKLKYAVCPRCRYKVNVSKSEIIEDKILEKQREEPTENKIEELIRHKGQEEEFVIQEDQEPLEEEKTSLEAYNEQKFNCPNCNAEVKPYSNFCLNCGVELNWSK